MHTQQGLRKGTIIGASVAMTMAGAMLLPSTAFADGGNEGNNPSDGEVRDDGIASLPTTVDDGEVAVAEAQQAYDQATSDLHDAEATQARAQDGYDDAVDAHASATEAQRQLDEDIEQSVQEAKDKAQRAEDDAEDAVRDAQKAEDDAEDGKAQAEDALAKATDDEGKAKGELTDAQAKADAERVDDQAVDRLGRESASKTEVTEAAKAAYDKATDEEADAQQGLTDALENLRQRKEDLDAASKALDDAEETSEKAHAEQKACQEAYDGILANESATAIEKQIALEESQRSLDALQEELRQAQAGLDGMRDAHEEARSVLAQAQDALDAAEKASKQAQADCDATEEELEDARSTKSVATAELEQARTVLEAAQKALGETDSAIASKQAELSRLQDEVGRLSEQVAAAKERQKTAQATYDAAKSANKGSISFFQSVGATAAAGYLTNRSSVGYDDSGHHTTFYATMTPGGQYDATNIENMLEALDWIEYCNTHYRKPNGLSTLLVTDTMMASAQRNANFSTWSYSHAYKSDGYTANIAATANGGSYAGENLYFSFVGVENAYRDWYGAEKAIWDEAVRKNPSLRQYATNAYGLMQTNPSLYYQVGHYLNIIDPSYNITGIGLNTSPSEVARNHWAGAVTQQFMGAQIGGGIGTAYTVSQYRQRLLSWYSKNGGNIKEAEAALAKAKETVTSLTDKLTSTKAQASDASKALAGLSETRASQEKAVSDQQETIRAAEATIAQTDSAIADKTAELAQRQDALGKATEALAQAQEIYQEKQTTFDSIDGEFSKRQADCDAKAQAVDKAQAKTDEARADLERTSPEFAKAIARLSDAVRASDEADRDLATREADKAQAEQAYGQASRTVERMEKTLRQRQEELAQASTSYATAKETSDRAREEYLHAKGIMDAVSRAQRALDEATEQREQAIRFNDEMTERLKKATANLQDAIDTLSDARDRNIRAQALTTETARAGSITDADFSYLNAKDALDEASARVATTEAAMREAEEALGNANTAYEQAKMAYDDAVADFVVAQARLEWLLDEELAEVVAMVLTNLDPNGGTVTGSPVLSRIARNLYLIESLPVPTKGGCDFLGWFAGDGTMVSDAQGISGVYLNLLRRREFGMRALGVTTGASEPGSPTMLTVDEGTTFVAQWQERKDDANGWQLAWDDGSPTVTVSRSVGQVWTLPQMGDRRDRLEGVLAAVGLATLAGGITIGRRGNRC